MRGNLGLVGASADRARPAAIIADRNDPKMHVWRAEVPLLTGDGLVAAEIMRRTGLGLTLAGALPLAERRRPFARQDVAVAYAEAGGRDAGRGDPTDAGGGAARWRDAPCGVTGSAQPH